MYPIKAVAIKTGLTTHTIRVWERRYEIIHPQRTETNRRLYSEEEVQKLILLKKATQAGHSIGQLSKMPLEEIKRLVQEQNVVRVSSMSNRVDLDEESPEYYVKAALQAAEDFDNEAIDDMLTQASVNFSQPVLIDGVVVPFLNALGDKWFDGEVRIAQEHVASAVVRSFLGRMLSSVRTVEKGPTLLTATVSGLYHEFGAMIVAISAATQGWRAHYLGPNLPAEEIAFSVKKTNARAVVISIVFPPNDDIVREQLLQLRRVLPQDVALLVGGRAADSYMSTLQTINTQPTHSMSELREQLLELRMRYKESLEKAV
ncbi:MerR family transcriptional regulator [candidate division KSB1 bacterium]|nr:MerR family transcriptional regulator [candidate division KSB1 bacterium]